MNVAKIQMWVNRLARSFKKEDKEDIFQSACLYVLENNPEEQYYRKSVRICIWRHMHKPNGTKRNQEIPSNELPEQEWLSDVESVINFNQIKNIILQINKLSSLQKRVLLMMWDGDEPKDIVDKLSRSALQVGYQSYPYIKATITREMM